MYDVRVILGSNHTSSFNRNFPFQILQKKKKKKSSETNFRDIPCHLTTRVKILKTFGTVLLTFFKACQATCLIELYISTTGLHLKQWKNGQRPFKGKRKPTSPPAFSISFILFLSKTGSSCLLNNSSSILSFLGNNPGAVLRPRLQS